MIYNNERLDLGRMIKADFNDMELDAVLDEVLSGSGMGYKFVNDYIVIVPQKEEKENLTSQTVKEKNIKGVVKDEEGSLLPGVTVLIKGTTIGTATDVNGAFSLNIPDMKDIVLLFSFVGCPIVFICGYGDERSDVRRQDRVERGYGVGRGTSG